MAPRQRLQPLRQLDHTAGVFVGCVCADFAAVAVQDKLQGVWVLQPAPPTVTACAPVVLYCAICCGAAQVTAWIPLLDVNAENGCMQLLSGGHRAGKTVQHTGAVGDTW